MQKQTFDELVQDIKSGRNYFPSDMVDSNKEILEKFRQGVAKIEDLGIENCIINDWFVNTNPKIYYKDQEIEILN